MRNAATEPPVLLRIPEEVDNLAQFVLGLLDPGDVRKRDLVAGRLIAAGT